MNVSVWPRAGWRFVSLPATATPVSSVNGELVAYGARAISHQAQETLPSRRIALGGKPHAASDGDLQVMSQSVFRAAGKQMQMTSDATKEALGSRNLRNRARFAGAGALISGPQSLEPAQALDVPKRARAVFDVGFRHRLRTVACVALG